MGLLFPSHLVLYEGQEGADDERNAFEKNSRELVAHALPSPCWHDDKHVSSAENCIYDLEKGHQLMSIEPKLTLTLKETS